MIKNINYILRNHLAWIKNDLFFLVGLNFFAFLIFYIVKPHYLIQVVALTILFIKCTQFIKLYSLVPSIASSGDRFSWKFLQGLPVNKRELLISLSISRLLVSIPVLTWISFFSSLIGDVLIEAKVIDSYNIFLLVINLILFLTLTGISSIHVVINYPRMEYQKKNRNQLIISIRYFLIIIVAAIYFTAGALAFNEYYGVALGTYISKVADWVEALIFSWWLVPILFLTLIFQYRVTMKTWLDEKKSYKPVLPWNPMKEWSIISVLSILMVYPLTQIDYDTPIIYRGNSLVKAVYYKSYKQIEKEVNTNQNINSKNKYGFSPMLAAIHEGNTEMVILLNKLGAKIEGSINGRKKHLSGFDPLMLAVQSKNTEMVQLIISKGFQLNQKNSKTGFYPIHLASALCDSRMLDFLIKSGADVNSLNDKGETPLIVAARNNCFSSAVSLQAAGAAFDIIDKNGKRAASYFLKSQNKEFRYFLEKHSRLPSSK